MRRARPLLFLCAEQQNGPGLRGPGRSTHEERGACKQPSRLPKTHDPVDWFRCYLCRLRTRACPTDAKHGQDFGGKIRLSPTWAAGVEFINGAEPGVKLRRRVDG